MTAWSDYFFIRLDDSIGYYLAWKGTKRPVFSDKYFRTYESCRTWIKDNDTWRQAVDIEFEKEVLGGSEHSEANDASED